MNNLADYLIKSGISLTILYMFYWMLLRRDTHFKLNRLVLVLSLAGSLLVPFVNIYLIANQQLQSTVPFFYASLDGVIINIASNDHIATNGTFNWWKLLLIIYIIGMVVVTAKLIYQGIYLHVVAKISKTIRKDNFTLVFMNSDITPFAYFNKIFIPASEADDASIRTIVAHEKSHLRQYHFIDLFLVEMVTILQWFNPVVWLYERSLKEVHEYLADEEVLNHGQNKGVYQALLVNQAIGGPIFSLTNHFNQSLIKKRIIMMTKIKTPRLAQLKALLVVPLLLLMLAAFANPKTATNSMFQKDVNLLKPMVHPSNHAEINDPKGSALITDTITPQQTSKSEKTDETPLQIVDQMPEYPGGLDSLMRFLARNIKYPAYAAKKNITGKVIVQFVIGKLGNIHTIKIVRGIGGGCDEEALRVVKSMPNWKPGRQNGKPVPVYFTLPILFQLKE